MSTRPVITVIGATGAQGGGLARAILADPARSFVVRAVTREPDGGAARALAAQGAEVVQADLDDAASLERAMHDTYGVFAVTTVRGHHSPERELLQASHVARAARRAVARHVIWSTWEDIRQSVRQVDTKGAADALFGDLPTTLLRTAFCWDNLVPSGMGPRRGADGVLEFMLPMGTRRLPGIAAADVGPCALGIFQRCGQFIGSTVGLAGEHLTGAEMAAALSVAIGEPVRPVPVSFADHKRLGFPGAADPAPIFQHQHDFPDACCDERPVERTRELHPDVMSFERWLARYIHRIPVPVAAPRRSVTPADRRSG